MWTKRRYDKWLDVDTIFKEFDKWDPDTSREFKAHLIARGLVSSTDVRKFFRQDKEMWKIITTDNVCNLALTPKDWIHFIAREEPKHIKKELVEYILEELSMMLLSKKEKQTIPLKKSITKVRKRYGVL